MDGRCVFCQAHDEDLYHALFLCLDISNWRKTYFPPLTDFGYQRTVMDLVLHFKGVGNTEHTAKVFTMAWELWG